MARYHEMRWDQGNTAEEFKLFKQRMELCLTDNDVTDNQKKANKIQIYIGTEGLRRLNASGLSVAEKKDPGKLWDLFENQLKIKVNFRIHRLEIMRYKQQPGETIEEFVSRCRLKAQECDFDDTELSERVMDLVINSTQLEGFQKELLEKPKGYPLQDLIQVGRRYEAIAEGGVRLNNIDKSIDIDALFQRQSNQPECWNCGLQHPPRRCPAYRDTCKHCNKIGHWARKCPSKRGQRKPSEGYSRGRGRGRGAGRGRPFRRGGRPQSPRPRHEAHEVHEVRGAEGGHDYYDNTEEASEVEFYGITVTNSINIDMVQNDNEDRELFVSVDIICPQKRGQHRLKLKVDSGAWGNTLPTSTVKKMYSIEWESMISKTTDTLHAYNGTKIPTRGYIDLVCRYGKQPWSTEKFYVVDVDRPAVMGLPTIRKLKIMTFNVIEEITPTTRPIQSIENLVREFPDCFDRIGNFKEAAKIHMKPDAKPYVDAPRKCSIHIKPKLKQELQKMEDQGVIKRVTKHTDWCSSITSVVKKDGSLRVCLDPKRLNQAVKRCPHKIPTLEELNPEFANAKYFSKLDAKAGYWSVHLEEESQELTTFRTPFGRYCFRRLPFGLSISQDVFQQHMDNILEKAPGCVGIADDVAVYGATQDEHDRNLRNLMQVAREAGLVFNKSKCVIGTAQIEFFGSLYTSDGIKPDPAKVQDICKMPTPQDKEDLRKFLGMISYLGAFIPKLAEHAHSLRELLKQDVPYLWQEDHQENFQKMKQLVSSSTCLKYYDPTKPTVVEVDASQKGLGACLLQDNQPVMFASKTLTDAQKNYSNIERETLAMVFGIRRLHTYLFGKEFTLMTDHKPLEMIWSKPLASAPPRLQRLLVKLLGYDFEVKYKPGSTMILADVLSRLPNPDNNAEEPLDVGVDEIEIAESLDVGDDSQPTINIDLVNFGVRKQEELQTETPRDPILRQVWQTIITGWPDSMKELPTDIRPYWAFRDELGISNSTVFKGRQVLIPEALRPDVLQQLHQGHMGIERTRRLARESVYWPNINQDIENLVKKCPTCQQHQPCQQKEPLDPHDIPSTPWYKLATDLFCIGKENYIVIIDYHSKFPVVSKLPNTTSETIAKSMSAIFSLFGPPSIIMSDNGPQFTGAAFKAMCDKWGITHTTSSPRYPRSNGLAERTVRSVKELIKKCMETNQSIQIGMQHLRATPLDGNTPSPAEILFGRQIRTTLPSCSHPGSLQKPTEVFNKLQEKQVKMKSDHDRHAGPELAPLHVGQKVFVQDADSKKWDPGEITLVCKEPRSYLVASPNGSTLRRNRSHLREMYAPCDPSSSTPTRKRVQFKDDMTAMKTTENDCISEEPISHQPTLTRRSGRVCRKPMRYRSGDEQE